MTYVGFSLLMPRSFMNGRRTRFLGYSIVSLIAIILAWRHLPETNPVTRERVRHPIFWSRPWVLLRLATAVTDASWAMVSPMLTIVLQEKLAIEVANW